MVIVLMSIQITTQAQRDSSMVTPDVFEKIEADTNYYIGKVEIHQQQEIRELVHQHVANHYQVPGIRGYRIRIFSIYAGPNNNDARERANQVKNQFQDQYPEVSAYVKWDAPDFKVYVGDFRRRLDAVRMLDKIKKEYPAAFPVYTLINYPEL